MTNPPSLAPLKISSTMTMMTMTSTTIISKFTIQNFARLTLPLNENKIAERLILKSFFAIGHS